MCRMIAAPMGVPGELLIEPFLRMAEGRNALNEHNTAYGERTHANGWGAVYEEDDRSKILRSVAACWEDEPIEALRGKRVFLLHARRASLGGVSLLNTHPFEHEIDGARWIFCHNGTVRDPLQTPPTLAKSGSTDSERVFHMLLPCLREGRALEGFRELYCGFRDFTSLNTFLLGHDDFWAVSLCTLDPVYYVLTLAKTPEGPIVSSEPLAEFATEQTSIHSGNILHIDRRTGAIETRALGCPARA